MDRRFFLQQVALGATFARTARAQIPDLDEATFADLSQYPASQLTEYYIGRIRERDAHTRAVVEINPDAMKIAAELDRGPRRGPLHGMPVLIKDNIDTADAMKTTAGSLAMMDAPRPADAAVVARLRAAGAVILGKTNLSEWANFRSSHSLSGWSARGGQTRNPYALDRSPCGSSAGSAVAVSANLCAAAAGTETDGSITGPSSMNGLVGIKPTVGLLGGSGIIPIAHSQDTAGPMARTVRDAAILLGAMAEGPKADLDYTRFLDSNGLRGARIAVARSFFGITAETDRVIENAIAEMKRQGAEMIDPADLPSHGKAVDVEMEVLLYEFKAGLNAYLKKRGTGLTLEKLIEFNSSHREQEMPHFEQELFERAQEKGTLHEKEYRKALAATRKLARAEGIDAVVKRHRVDAIIAPTTGPAWLIDVVNGDHDTGGSTGPAARAGYPHITVPAGFVRGLPVGISFFGPAWSEGTLLKLAFGFEQATRVRKPPRALAGKKA